MRQNEIESSFSFLLQFDSRILIHERDRQRRGGFLWLTFLAGQRHFFVITGFIPHLEAASAKSQLGLVHLSGDALLDDLIWGFVCHYFIFIVALAHNISRTAAYYVPTPT